MSVTELVTVDEASELALTSVPPGIFAGVMRHRKASFAPPRDCHMRLSACHPC